MAVCSITRNSHSGTQCQQVACECVSLFCATIFKKKYVLFCFVGGNGSGVSFYLFFAFFSFVIVVLHLTEGGNGPLTPLPSASLCSKDGGLCGRVGERRKRAWFCLPCFCAPASATVCFRDL